MKKALLIAAVVVVLLIVGGGVAFWFIMQQPLYEPGMVAAGKNLRAPLVPPAQSTDKDFWTVESDIKLFHFTDGAGVPVLVVHGGPGFPFTQPLRGLKPLTGQYAFHYYDQRGSGKSSRPITAFSSSNYYENMQMLDKTLGLGAQIADIERIRQILGQDRIIIIGHSFGGFLASLYAAEFPDRVKALVLVAPAETLVMPPPSGGLFEQVKPLLPEEMRKEYEEYLKRSLDYGSIFAKSESELASINAGFGPYYAAAAQRKGFAVPAGSSTELGGGWMVQAMYMSMGLRHDYRGALKTVRAPVLVLHGENDLQPEAATRMYSESFPNAEFKTIKSAGHFSFDDQPEAFAGLVGDFLSKAR